MHIWRSSTPRCCAGFTLLELLVVLAIVAFASAGVGFALQGGTQTRLEREAIRLSALLESARAQAQVRGVPMRWYPTEQGFRFDPEITLDDQTVSMHWLDPDTRAQVLNPVTSGNADSLLLGPDPIIGPQTVTLYAASQPDQRLRLATDGVRPFAIQAATP